MDTIYWVTLNCHNTSIGFWHIIHNYGRYHIYYDVLFFINDYQVSNIIIYQYIYDHIA